MNPVEPFSGHREPSQTTLSSVGDSRVSGQIVPVTTFLTLGRSTTTRKGGSRGKTVRGPAHDGVDR